jgi:two-component system OmpR family sensor kinase
MNGSGEFQAGQPPKPPGRHGMRWESLRRLSDRLPLRAKLITAVLTLVIIALTAISIASVIVLRPTLYSQRDNDLRRELARTQRYLAENQVEITLGLATTDSGFIGAVQQPGKQLSAPPPGQGFFGTHSAQQLPLPTLPTTKWTNSAYPTIITQPAQSGGDTWRVIGLTVAITSNSTGAQSTAPLVVAVDLGPLNAELRNLILIDLAVGAGIVVILAIITIAVVRANLRPLDDIELTAGQIAAGHLDHRIPERDPRTEVGSLGRSLNTMLSQIEAAFHAREESEAAAHRSEERMRRFIADASHELRTPLTTIRGFAEYYRQRGGAKQIHHPFGVTDSGASGMPAATARLDGMTPEELDRIMRRLESEASRMGLLVEDLLQLARLDQQRPLDMRPVDLLTLAADAVQDARLVAPDRTIDLSVASGAAFLVDGDEQRLRQVIGNLVNNALTHTPAGTAVRVTIGSGTVKSGAPAVVLDVIDDGPGMTAEQAQRAFERFYRADAARNRASGGTGLGLAIVAGLVTAHGGQVSVKTAPGQGADFRVKLPLSPDALPADGLPPDDPAFDDDPPVDGQDGGHPADAGQGEAAGVTGQ